MYNKMHWNDCYLIFFSGETALTTYLKIRYTNGLYCVNEIDYPTFSPLTSTNFIDGSHIVDSKQCYVIYKVIY